MADDGADSPSHPRARAILTVDERVEHIVGMMERLEWVRGKSAPELAAQWGFAVSTIEGHAAEAHRRVIQDPEDIKRDLITGCRKLFKSAVDNDEVKDATAIGGLLASVSGAKAPQKIDATVSSSSDDDERLAGKLARLVAGIQADEDSGSSDSGGTPPH